MACWLDSSPWVNAARAPGWRAGFEVGEDLAGLGELDVVPGHPDDEVPGKRVVPGGLGRLHGEEVVLLSPLVLAEVAAGVGGQACGVGGGVEQLAA
jgi:hypothetical protein